MLSNWVCHGASCRRFPIGVPGAGRATWLPWKLEAPTPLDPLDRKSPRDHCGTASFTTVIFGEKLPIELAILTRVQSVIRCHLGEF